MGSSEWAFCFHKGGGYFLTSWTAINFFRADSVTLFHTFNKRPCTESLPLGDYGLGSVADHLVFCSVITKPRMRAPHGAGWPLPPLYGGGAMAVYGTGGRLRAEGAKRNGSRGNEVNREEMKRRAFWYSRSRCGTHAADFQNVAVSSVGCLMQHLTWGRIWKPFIEEGISGLWSIWMQNILTWDKLNINEIIVKPRHYCQKLYGRKYC